MIVHRLEVHDIFRAKVEDQKEELVWCPADGVDDRDED